MDEHDRGKYDPMATPAAPHPAESPSEPAPQPMMTAKQDPVGPGYWQKSHKALTYTLIALVVIAVAAAAYWFVLKPKPVAKTTTTTIQTQTQAAQAASTIATATKNYSSPNFNLSFDYPQDWTVADNGGGVMTVKSPSLQLKNASGQLVAGQVVLTIRDHVQKLSEFDSGNSTATRDSQKVAYTKPTQNQRANTYLSFLQYASTTTTGALDGVYITGDSGYTKGQAIPLVDVQKVDPVISVTFLTTSGKALSIADSAWDNSSFSTPLTNMLKSFAIN